MKFLCCVVFHATFDRLGTKKKRNTSCPCNIMDGKRAKNKEILLVVRSANPRDSQPNKIITNFNPPAVSVSRLLCIYTLAKVDNCTQLQVVNLLLNPVSKSQQYWRRQCLQNCTDFTPTSGNCCISSNKNIHIYQ